MTIHGMAKASSWLAAPIYPHVASGKSRKRRDTETPLDPHTLQGDEHEHDNPFQQPS
jgi:hypothetical protein